MIRLFICLGTLLLSACSHDTLNAPCPDFGRHCTQIPINTWHKPGKAVRV